MGAGGVPNRAVENIYGKRGDLPTKGAKPNSRYDLYFEGIRIQSRWFDSNGCVVRNRDYNHQNAHNNHFFPHDHNWVWENGMLHRISDILEPDYNKYY